MPIAPSTATHTDKLRETKELSDRLAVLKSAKERAEADTRVSAEAATASRLKAAELDGIVKEIASFVPAAAAEARDFIHKCAEAVRQAAEDTRTAMGVCRIVTAETEAAIRALGQARRDAEEVHRSALAETIEMERKRGDLDIYHKRLLKHFEEHMPGQKLDV